MQGLSNTHIHPSRQSTSKSPTIIRITFSNSMHSSLFICLCSTEEKKQDELVEDMQEESSKEWTVQRTLTLMLFSRTRSHRAEHSNTVKLIQLITNFTELIELNNVYQTVWAVSASVSIINIGFICIHNWIDYILLLLPIIPNLE